jgi:hypothetical protein
VIDNIRIPSLRRFASFGPSRPFAFALILVANLCVPLFGQTNTFPSTGNVGIGTTSPAYKLDLIGNARFNLGSGGGQLTLASNPNDNSVYLEAFDSAFDGGSASNLFITGAYSGMLPKLNVFATTSYFSGNVGIGTTNPQHLLHVAGTIGAEEVIVSSTGADYVFQPGYRLRPLSEIGAFIQENHHLPGIPSAAETQKEGLNLGEMQTKMLAKIEELTLHMIEADQRNQNLEKQNRDLQERIARLEASTLPKEAGKL